MVMIVEPKNDTDKRKRVFPTNATLSADLARVFNGFQHLNLFCLLNTTKGDNVLEAP